MKVAIHLVEGRRRDLAEYLQHHAYAPLRDVCARFKVSSATARRDLTALAAQKQIVRTYGGAITDYNQRFPSFRERQQRCTDAKRRIGAAARDMIEPGNTCFLDFSTTVYAVAEALRRQPVANLRVITNSLPVAELLALVPGARVHMLGGEILPRQSALLGKAACKSVGMYRIDRAFIGAEAANRTGVWNSQGEVVELQRTVLKSAAHVTLCMDASKLRHSAPAFLAPWSQFDLLITDRPSGRLDFVKCARLAA